MAIVMLALNLAREGLSKLTHLCVRRVHFLHGGHFGGCCSRKLSCDLLGVEVVSGSSATTAASRRLEFVCGLGRNAKGRGSKASLKSRLEDLRHGVSSCNVTIAIGLVEEDDERQHTLERFRAW
jgi:hypothetical protein